MERADTWSATKTTPIATSGPVVDPPPDATTAPITAPVVIANTGGSTERSTTSAHQAEASGRPARGRCAKNCHSCRSRNLRTLPP